MACCNSLLQSGRRIDDGCIEAGLKRQKVSIACDQCRIRKTKCDGVRPVCRPCSTNRNRAAQCRWDPGLSSRGGIPRNHIKYLESRIMDLERRGFGPSPQQAAATASQHFERSRGLDQPGKCPAEPKIICPASAQKEWVSTFTDVVQDNSSEDLKSPARRLEDCVKHRKDHNNEVNAIMGEMHDGSQDQGLFGTSSASSFIKQVKLVIDTTIGSQEDAEQLDVTLGQEQLCMARAEPKLAANVDLDYSLPSRKMADSLMCVYWELVHPLYPFLDREDTENVYGSLWTSDGPVHDDSIDLCIVNIIFALSCQLSPDIKTENRTASAEVFFERAKYFLKYDVWQIGSFQLVQCFLIFGQYLQSVNNPHQCWTVIGLAVRTAQSLGLHLPGTSSRVSSPRVQETMRRVWYGCVLMDNVLSMTYGRPGMIGRRAALSVPLPLAVDEQYLSQDSRTASLQPRDRPAMVDFYVNALRLNQILHEILLNFYTPSADSSKLETCETWSSSETTHGSERSSVGLDQALTIWCDSLPPHLRSGQASVANETFSRQANVLRQRYLNTRILLYRPILSRLLSSMDTETSQLPRTPKSLLQRMAIECSTLCVQTAQEAIENIHSHLPPSPALMGPLSAWWRNIFYLYTAATVLLAARLRSCITTNIPQKSIDQSWCQAIVVLHQYELHSSFAKHCVAVLQMLSDKVPEHFMRRKNQPHHVEPRRTAVTMQPSTMAEPRTIPDVPPMPYFSWCSDGEKDLTELDFNLTDDAGVFDTIGTSKDATDMWWLDSFPSSL